MARTFVNIYKDGDGRFISDFDYDSLEDAISAKDPFDSYIETVEIIRHPLPSAPNDENTEG